MVVAELRYGVRRLPAGQRRDRLERDLDVFFSVGFANRIVAFDASCAEAYAGLRTRREQAGRPVSVQDALIGATALVHGATLATRNVADFDGYGLTLVNPWDAS